MALQEEVSPQEKVLQSTMHINNFISWKVDPRVAFLSEKDLLRVVILANTSRTIATMYLPFLNLEEINDYALGAAALATLKCGMKNAKKAFEEGKTPSLGGFSYALMANIQSYGYLAQARPFPTVDEICTWGRDYTSRIDTTRSPPPNTPKITTKDHHQNHHKEQLANKDRHKNSNEHAEIK
ncbi:hypothetical protein TIFTF001_013488 [Ficus carica]|uniref:Uncharacterized protein n=1 Tax=Ficus carica TaxID=3494 RepID=A0AA87ZV15_FICCA|nr:hypothetical protein TIFTF001_013488 [Ficus carica]